jgi:predicted DsbA family dithiol-disulfide isomerase
MPNSLNAHRLINLVGTGGNQSAMVEALFHAYFVEAIDIGEIGNLAAIAVAQGLDGKEVDSYLRSNAGVMAVETENARMHRLGVSGVPCYIFDDSYAIAGAQDPEIIARLLDIACEAALETTSR